jgi:hypothetical protein
MTVRRCCVVRCRKPATVVHDLGPAHLDAEPVRKDARIRRYEVCEDHNKDYFGRGRFLSVEQVERIRRDLVATAIG